jgi:tetratricopeptide (TPR) repeat protein
MTRILFALAILWSIVVAPSVTIGQSSELITAFRKYQSLLDAGKYAEAETAALRALEIGGIELGPGHPSVATLFHDLAVIYTFQGRYIAAELLYKRALAVREKALGPNHPDVATARKNLAEFYRARGR